MSKKLLTVTAYANHRGVSQPRISYLIREGRIKKGIAKRKGRRLWIDPAIADQELEASRDPRWDSKRESAEKALEKKNVEQGPEEEAAPAATLTINTLKKALLQYKLANEKWDYEVKAGKWIPSDIVEKTFFDCGRLIRDQCQNIPTRIGALVAAESDTFECEKILKKEINFVLEDLASALQIPK